MGKSMMMVRSTNLFLLKNKVFLSFLCFFMTLFVFRAFINGLGCSFSLESESVNYFRKSQCEMGVLVIETQDKLSGEVKIKKMRWGFWGGITIHGI